MVNQAKGNSLKECVGIITITFFLNVVTRRSLGYNMSGWVMVYESCLFSSGVDFRNGQ